MQPKPHVHSEQLYESGRAQRSIGLLATAQYSLALCSNNINPPTEHKPTELTKNVGHRAWGQQLQCILQQKIIKAQQLLETHPSSPQYQSKLAYQFGYPPTPPTA